MNQQAYNAAIARGESAALLEQEKRDIFRQQIGNIPPRSRVNVRITYLVQLRIETDGAVRFVLPTTVAPRYQSGVEFVPSFAEPWTRYCRRLSSYNNNHNDVRSWIPKHVVSLARPCAFSITIEAEMPSVITLISSKSHAIRFVYCLFYIFAYI